MRDRLYARAAALLVCSAFGCQPEPSQPVSRERDSQRESVEQDDDDALGSGKRRDAGAARDAASAKKQRDAEADAAPSATHSETNTKRPAFCARPDDDVVRAMFCTSTPPPIRSLRELQDLFRVNPRPRDPGAELDTSRPIDPYSVVSVAVFITYSTALSGHLVSPINPRAIILGDKRMMTFQRGVQQVELVSFSRAREAFNFYLLTFEQACNAREDGCSPGDLYTPSIESDWTSVQIQDDEELKNTQADCRQCHQRGLEKPVLLMRELESPWTHFFETDPEVPPVDPPPGVRGRHLLRDYLQAKGDEPYADVPEMTLRSTIPLVLENRMSLPQPLVFESRIIEDERWPLGPNGYASEPLGSPTWERAYEAFKRGEQLALPYFEPRVTDPDKQARLTEAYRRYRNGELSAEELPDFADIFPDDPQLRALIGLQTEPNATPAELLVQACGACHNDVLDQSISRARFNIDLARMERAELDLAIERLKLPKSTLGVMPPPEARQLDEQARERLIAYLRDNKPSSEEAAFLARAAQLGMAGP